MHNTPNNRETFIVFNHMKTIGFFVISDETYELGANTLV